MAERKNLGAYMPPQTIKRRTITTVVTDVTVTTTRSVVETCDADDPYAVSEELTRVRNTHVDGVHAALNGAV